MSSTNQTNLVITFPNIEYSLFIIFIFYLGVNIYNRYQEYQRKLKLEKYIVYFNSCFIGLYSGFLINLLGHKSNCDLLNWSKTSLNKLDDSIKRMSKIIDQINSFDKQNKSLNTSGSGSGSGTDCNYIFCDKQ